MDIGIRDLKARLSEHLDRVAHGEVITVTSRGRRVAQIVPILGRDSLDRGLAGVGSRVRWSAHLSRFCASGHFPEH